MKVREGRAMRVLEQAAVHAQVLTAGLQQGQTHLALITSTVGRENSELCPTSLVIL